VGDYRREAALEDLASVVASVSEGSPVLLVGHSVGGYLCLAHTLVHPETVAGLALVSTGPGFRNPERRAAYNRSMEKVAQRAGYPPSVAALAIQHDTLVIDGIPSIACPSVVIVGAEDLDVYVAGARYLAERLPRADLVEIKGAGHDPHRERPDEVNVALLGLAGLALA
jgi:pimeloyl-ACP methyl ester carboxylesterase